MNKLDEQDEPREIPRKTKLKENKPRNIWKYILLTSLLLMVVFIFEAKNQIEQQKNKIYFEGEEFRCTHDVRCHPFLDSCLWEYDGKIIGQQPNGRCLEWSVVTD